MAAGPISYCVAHGTRFVCRLDFELLPDGNVPHPGDVISDQFRAATGISFPDGGATIRPLAGTSSPAFALRNATNVSEEETNPGPLRLVFDNLRVTRLSLRAGLDQPVSGVRPVLTVFDADGAALQVVTGAVLPDGPTAVEEPIEIAPSGFFISRANLLYDGTTAAARDAVEVIDDLEIEIADRPPCPPKPDTNVPLVVFTSPDDTSQSRTLPRLEGTIGETSGMLLHVTAEVSGPAGSYAVDLSPYVLQNSGAPGLFTFSLNDLELFGGENRVTISTEDGGCPPNHNVSFFDVDQIGPDPDLNLYALALEITQSIQDQLQAREVAREGSDPTVFAPIPFAGVPLVANKRTVVRAYAEVQDTVRRGSAVHGVPAQLIIRRGGSETDLVAAGITIDPADQVNLPGGMRDLERTLANKRRAITKSWNFVLPDSLTAPGAIDEIELRVNPPTLSGPSECTGCDDAANRLRVSSIPFTQLATMSMRTYYLAQDAEVGKMPGADGRTFCGQLARMFPLADGCGTGPINRNDFDFGINLLSLTRLDPKVNGLVGMDGRSVNAGVAQGRMCESMYWDGLHTIPGFTPPADYFGLVPAGVPFDGPFIGVGGPNHARYFPSACSSGGEGDWAVAAQEIGHGMLVRDEAGMDISMCTWHAPCGGPACPLATFPLYPDPSGSTYPSASIGQFGLDTQTLAVFDPQTTFDFMSYCGPVWTSPFSYRIMFAHFRDRLELGGGGGAGAVGAAGSAESEYLVTYGDLGENGQVSFGPFYRTTLPAGTDDDVGAGAYSLELRDQDGALLFERRFDFPGQAAHQRPSQPPLPPRFRETVPWDPATRQIICKHGDTVIASRLVSPSTPLVMVITPNGGESWAKDSTETIHWNASDADGDPLVYKVEYSTDGGGNWRTLTTDLTEDTLVVNAAFLPGSDTALLRVSASDGVNTAVDESDATFTVARKDPAVSIGGVEDNAVVEAGTVLNLVANYVDPNEEGIPDGAFVWRAAGLGVLGAGAHLELPATDLPPGPHRITVTVPGRNGPPVSAAVTILRAPRLRELLAACSGDCDGDGAVSVAELVLGVDIALGRFPMERCLPVDTNLDSTVTVDELVAAVDHGLRGCRAGPGGP